MQVDVDRIKYQHDQESAAKLLEAQDFDRTERLKLEKSVNYRLWFRLLLLSIGVGLLGGLALKSWAPSLSVLAVGILGFLSSILALGTNGLFQPDEKKHYLDSTQRVLACVGGLALGASVVTLFP